VPFNTPYCRQRCGYRAVHGLLLLSLSMFCLLHVECWFLSYMYWPWSPDHDVFATLARSWDAGLLPYRDMYANNPPPTIYLYWVLGKVFGWGRTAPFFAFDATLVVALAVVMMLWSERLFASVLPGLVGYSLFLRDYLPLDYSMIGERDWHSSVLAVVAIMMVQAWPGRRSRIASALALALAVATRPQAVFFVPAAVTAIAVQLVRKAADRMVVARGLLEFAVAFTGLFAVAFAPVVIAGVFGDFLVAMRRAAYGGVRNPLSVAIFWERVSGLLARPEVAASVASIAVLACCARTNQRRLAWAWLVAAAGAIVYKPLSPRQHDYLDIPRYIVLSATLSVIVGVILQARLSFPLLRLGATLLVAGLCSEAQRSSRELPWAYASWRQLREGLPPILYPNGYVGPYPLQEYIDLLQYAKEKLAPEVRIANALEYPLAITGPTGRLSAFPAESMMWLRYVRPDDEDEFIRKLERTPSSVVVWCPAEFDDGLTGFARLKDVIRRLYEPEKRFFAIEVWRRKASIDGRRARP
jgi:hypothetical protein